MGENVFQDKALQKYLQDIANYEPLSKKEEKRYALRAQKGDKEARDILIRANLKFVVKVATKYQNKGLTLSQLISEGNVGLIKAIKKFDPSKNNKLISYAIWWIKQSILYALAEKNSVIRKPLGKANDTYKIKRFKKQYYKDHGKDPNVKEIVEATGIREKTVKKIEKDYGKTVSYDATFGYSGAESSVLKTFLENPNSNDPKEVYYEERINSKIKESIDKLSERAQFIVRSYFGMEGKEKNNFSELGKKLGISRERVRQIQVEALKEISKDVYEEYKTDIDYLIRNK